MLAVLAAVAFVTSALAGPVARQWSGEGAYPAGPYQTVQPLSTCVSHVNGSLPSWAPSTFQWSGKTRRYYVAAEEVYWDYAPDGWDNWLGVPLASSPRAASQIANGTKWTKAFYRGYTDETFSNYSQEPATQGSLGPILRAEVGDMIEILFLNKLSNNYASMHSMGLLYDTVNEGSDYPQTMGTNEWHVQDAVAPGGCTVYHWLVDSNSAPAQGEDSAAFAYHSYVNFPADANTGLIGPTVIYRSGMMETVMANSREYPILFNQYDESLSWLDYMNVPDGQGPYQPTPLVQPYSGNVSFWAPQLANMPIAGLTAQIFNTINGYIYANGAPFEVCAGETIIWYMYAYGAASHVMHLHGNPIVIQGKPMVAVSLNDGVMKRGTTTPLIPGTWQVICHVQNHLTNGMLHNYVVYPADSCPLPKLTGNATIA